MEISFFVLILTFYTFPSSSFPSISPSLSSHLLKKIKNYLSRQHSIQTALNWNEEKKHGISCTHIIYCSMQVFIWLVVFKYYWWMFEICVIAML